MRRTFLKAAGATVLASALPSLAAAYPARTVTIVVPFPPGSGSDVVARRYADELQKKLGATFVVDNRPGANGAIASSYVSRARPDGATVLLGTITTHSTNPALMKALPYDAVKDFTPLSIIGDMGCVLIVNAEARSRSLPEFAAWLKENAASANFGYGNGSSLIAAELFNKSLGVKVQSIPFKGTPQVLSEIMGGRIHYMIVDLPAATSVGRAPQLRMLAVTSRQRTPSLPEVPTFAEMGMPLREFSAWNGFFGPPGMDGATVEPFNTAVRAIAASPDMKAWLADKGFESFGDTPDEFAAFVKQQLATVTRLAKETGIEPQ